MYLLTKSICLPAAPGAGRSKQSKLLIFVEGFFAATNISNSFNKRFPILKCSSAAADISFSNCHVLAHNRLATTFNFCKHRIVTILVTVPGVAH